MSDRPSHSEETTLDQVPADSAQLREAPVRIRYFGDYELIREIARGGMGVVFEARQISLNRIVALKMILAGQLADETDVKRFYSEAEAVANLDHPGIVPIFEVGQHEGQHYFSMGFVEGQSLAQRLADGPLAPREAAALLSKVAHAIDYAHSRGVIHRDLKPGNILLDGQGNPRVTDFGLAKRLQSDSELTSSGQIMGTPSYMPPEQAGGQRGEVGQASDVYALGATLYALVTGRPPFQAATPVDTVLQVKSDDPVSPRRLNAAVDRDLETICLKCLEKEPSARYGSAAALALDLRRFLSGQPILARPLSSSERAWKWVRRKPVVSSLAALIVLVSALGLGGVIAQWREAVIARQVAESETIRAKSQTELAEASLKGAVNARAEEKKQRELADQRLYDARMTLVQRNWEDGDAELVQQGLDEQLPANQGGIDRRGFEWFYWHRLISSGHTTLKGHQGGVLSVAFSFDGKWIASAATDQTVKLWDATAAKEVQKLSGGGSTLAFSADSRQLVLAGRSDGAVKVWDIAADREVASHGARPGQVVSVALSQDARRLLAGNHDGTLSLWDSGTGREGRVLKGHVVSVSSVAFSRDGSRFASGGLDGVVKVWDTPNEKEVLSLNVHTGAARFVAFSPDGKPLSSASAVHSVSFSPDGTRLAAGSADATVRVWGVPAGNEILTLRGHSGAVHGVAFSPDGKQLATAGHDRTVKVWDALTGREMARFLAHTRSVHGVAFSPDGQRIASASLDRTVKVWDAVNGQGPLSFLGTWTGRAPFAADSTRLVYTGLDRSLSTLKVWHAARGRETVTLAGHTKGISSAVFSPDGKRVASASHDGTVKLWDATTAQEERTLRGHDREVLDVAFSPDGRRVASGGRDGSVRVWDSQSGQPTFTLTGHTGRVGVVTYSLGGKRLVSIGDAHVKVWDAQTGQEIGNINIANHSHRAAFTRDVRRLAIFGGIETLTVWDLDTGKEILAKKSKNSAILDAAFSPGGRWLATAELDGRVRVWDVQTGREALALKGHNRVAYNVVFGQVDTALEALGSAGGGLSSAVMTVAFSPDGQRLASGGRDGTVKVWDVATGQETLNLEETDMVYRVAFSPDGQRLATVSLLTVKLWDARPLDGEPAKPSPGLH
jgi:WD40 repeat protein